MYLTNFTNIMKTLKAADEIRIKIVRNFQKFL